MQAEPDNADHIENRAPVTRHGSFVVEALPSATFGGVVRFDSDANMQAALDALEADPESLPRAFYEAQGLLVLPGMQAINQDPELLVRLSRLFGPEVENYLDTPTAANMIHEQVREILVLSNLPPSDRQPPPQPDPPLTAEGAIPVQFPHRRGWHTDQSFRRPPPDISLFYAVIACPKGQGQTLYANAGAAYETLPARLRNRVQDLEGIHAIPWTGRSEEAVLEGETPKALKPHETSQRQPVVRVHPVTGKTTLYLCEDAQMDWILGPFVNMEPGPGGDGAALLYELMTHVTQPQFTYAHDWDHGDLVIHDNRNTLHSATWFDADRYERLMWRTTVRGNPGPEYAGEERSWLPQTNTKRG